MEETPLTFEVRLRPSTGTGGAVHVAGTVGVPGTTGRPFDGWLDLLALLEALVEGEG